MLIVSDLMRYFPNENRLADVEKGFAEVASTMGTEVEHLERVTDEYDSILEETKSYQKTRLIQDVMRVVLKASGENLTIDNKSEIDRLKIFLRGIPGMFCCTLELPLFTYKFSI